MEPETLQVTRLLRNPQWMSHYEEFLPDISEGLHHPANRLILAICQKVVPETNPQSPEDLLDTCLERSLTWTSEKEDNLTRISRGEVLKRSTSIREQLRKEEDPGTAEINFRNWLQRTITCNATMIEPVMLGSGRLSDPFQEASEKLTILQTRRFLSANENDNIVFPLENMEFSMAPKIPLGIDVFDEEEWDGGPEYDNLTTLAGESNIGKTHLGLFLMSSLASCRRNILIISGEDSHQENRKRLLCHFLQKSAKEVGRMTPEERAKRMKEIYGDPEDPQSLHYHLRTRFASVCPDEGKLTPSYIKERIDEMEQRTQEQVNAIMVDYLQKGKPDGKTSRMQRDEEFELFVNQLKAQGENKRNTLLISQVPSHAAGGGTEFLGIKQATARSYAATWGAHNIITMNRTLEETERLRGSDDKRAKINLFLCKNKIGPIGTCYAISYPREARWRFFRHKGDMERAFQNSIPTPKSLEERISE